MYYYIIEKYYNYIVNPVHSGGPSFLCFQPCSELFKNGLGTLHGFSLASQTQPSERTWF